MNVRLERIRLLDKKVHLLVVDGNRLLELGYSGAAGRRGWATFTDFDSEAEATEGRLLVVEELKREGYREAGWIPEPAVDELLSQLRAGSAEGMASPTGAPDGSDEAGNTWRDKTSAPGQADLDGLLKPALDFAEQQLERYRGFLPFAVVVDRSGEQRMVAAGFDTDYSPSSDVIALLHAGLVEERAQLRAAVVVADVRLPELGSDAVRLTMEHAEGIGLEVLVPYRIQRFRRAVEFAEMLVSETEGDIWTTGETSTSGH